MANLIEESQVYYDALETQTLDAVTDGAKKEKITSEEIIQVRNKAEQIVKSLKQNQVIHLGQKRRQMKIFGLNFSSPLICYDFFLIFRKIAKVNPYLPFLKKLFLN